MTPSLKEVELAKENKKLNKTIVDMVTNMEKIEAQLLALARAPSRPAFAAPAALATGVTPTITPVFAQSFAPVISSTLFGMLYTL